MKLNRFYVGSCNDVNQRLTEHNENVRKAYTNSANDWELFYQLATSNWSCALKIEGHIKRMKSRKYIKNLKEHSEISLRLLKLYN